MREFISGAGIVCIYFVVAASSMLGLRRLIRIPDELFRKMLHFILFFSYVPFAFAFETAEYDCLHDDGILYAKLLREAGIAVELNETKGTMHGFDIAVHAPTALAAMQRRIDFMKHMF